jgi:hypothetical protein
MPQVLNKFDYPTLPEGAVCVCAPSKWANPFKPSRGLSYEGAVNMYEEYLKNKPELWNALDELRGLDLVCFCHPKPCHADVLLKYANIEDI